MLLLFFVAAVPMAASLLYRIIVRPVISAHFGEVPSRWRDRDATRRRRVFENRLAGFFGSAIAVGIVFMIQQSGLPVPSAVFYVGYGICFMVSAWLVTDAIGRFRDPLNG